MLVSRDKKEVAKELQDLAITRSAQNKRRNEKWEGMEKMELGQWDMPESMRKTKWVIEAKSSDPADALSSATQVLSGIAPKLRMTPPAPGSDNKANSVAIERVLMHEYMLMTERHPDGFLENIVHSGLLYSYIIGQLVYIPHQVKVLKNIKVSTNRYKHAQRFGDFYMEIRNPKDVFPTFSSFGLDDILYVSTETKEKFLGTYGNAIPKGKRGKMRDNDELKYVLVYEYMDYDRHVLAYCASATQSMPRTGDTVLAGGDVGILFDVPNDLGFIPWAVKRVGYSTYTDPADKMKGLLGKVQDHGQWNIQNAALSLLTSEMFVRGGQARRRVTGPNPDEAFRTDHGEPGGLEKVGVGHQVETIPPDPIDRGMVEIFQMFGQAIGKSTVAKLLQNPEATADVPFSSMNLVFELGANSIKPYKKLAEKWLEEMFRIMLYYVDKFVPESKPIVVADKKADEPYSHIKLHKGMFDVKNIRLNVNLTEEIPTDMVAKVNAAAMMVRDLNYSLEDAYEDIGVPDPEMVMDKHAIEQMRLNELGIALEGEKMQRLGDVQLATQLKAMMAQMGIQQQAQQQAQGQQGGGGQPGNPNQPPQSVASSPNPATEGTQGQGSNPAMGGTPPARAAGSQATREARTGQTRSGGSIRG